MEERRKNTEDMMERYAQRIEDTIERSHVAREELSSRLIYDLKKRIEDQGEKLKEHIMSEDDKFKELHNALIAISKDIQDFKDLVVGARFLAATGKSFLLFSAIVASIWGAFTYLTHK